MEKSHHKIVKFEAENFEHLRLKFEVEILSLCIQILELIKNNLALPSLNNIAQKSTYIVQHISICSFLYKKVEYWMDGWMDGWKQNPVLGLLTAIKNWIILPFFNGKQNGEGKGRRDFQLLSKRRNFY